MKHIKRFNESIRVDKLDSIDELEDKNEGVLSDSRGTKRWSWGRSKEDESSIDDKIWDIVVNLYQNHTSIQAGYDDIMKLIKK